MNLYLNFSLFQSRRRIRDLELSQPNGMPIPRSDSQESMLEDSNDNSITPVLC